MGNWGNSQWEMIWTVGLKVLGETACILYLPGRGWKMASLDAFLHVSESLFPILVEEEGCGEPWPLKAS